MSRVKTRKEIKEEMDALAVSLADAKQQHAEKVQELESSIEGLTVDRDGLQAKVEELEAINANLTDEHATARAELVELRGAYDESQAGLEKATAALANPAFADAAIIPSDIDGQIEDAEADKQEADAEPEPEAEKTILEQYEGMEVGAERSAFWHDNKKQILREIEQREA